MKICKRAISIFLTLAILISALVINGFASGNLWQGDVATSFSSGNGTADDPYIITTAAELAYLSQQVSWGFSYEDCYFELGADIILNDTTNWEEWGTYDEDNNLNAPGNAWTPIGNTRYNSFYGNFDGKGYTVYGVYVNNTDSDYFGLFGYAGEPSSYGYSDRVTIKNLNVAQSYIYGAGNDYGYTPNIGGIVGYGNADNCTFSGKVFGETDASSYIGGIVGYGDAKNCTNYGTVTGSSAAGIVSHGNAYYCSNFGEIHGYDYAGGIAVDGCAEYCTNSGDIYASDPNGVGGVIVNAYGYSLDEITRYCYNSGNITVDGAYSAVIGGVVGNGIVSECYNSGDIILINSEGNNDVGGVIGSLDVNFEVALSGCYNAGALNLDCSGDIGAVVGENGDETAVEDCYYLDSSYSSDEYAISLTDAEMRVASSFKNWNFNRMWEYVEGAEYPYPTLRCFGSKKYYYSAVFCEGDGTVIKQVLAEENEEIIFTDPIKYDSKSFCYWENDGVKYNSGDTFVMTEDEVFYAVYERKNTSSKSWDGNIADSLKGSGTEDDPYLITSAAELAYLAESVNGGNKYTDKFFSLTKDIYLNDAVDDYNYFTMGENKWTPIGNSSNNYFNGHFDGNGHTVYGLYIKSSDRYAGVFGYSYRGKIKNLNVKNSTVYCYFENDDIYENNTIYAGLAVGFCYGEIENCSVSGIAQVVSNRYEYGDEYFDLFLGGVSGFCEKTVSGCVNNAEISMTSTNGLWGNLSGSFYLAGVLGRGTDVSNCVNNGKVSSFNVKSYYYNVSVYMTGVVGRAENVNDCTNNGKIFAEEFYLSNYENDKIYVSGISTNVEKEANECVNNGDIQGCAEAGGILISAGNNTVVQNCVNNGKVIGSKVGGIVANSNGLLRSCENKGDLSLNSNFNHTSEIGGIAASGNNAVGCINRGKITVDGESINSSYEIGGIFGRINNGNNAGAVNTVIECVNYGDIVYTSNEGTSDKILIGGIVGSGYENTLVERSNFKGNITATDIACGDIGGIIGSGNAADCLFEGNISVSGVPSYDAVYVGGIAGRGTVENSLSLGKVALEFFEGDSYNEKDCAGAVAGDPETAVTNSFYLYTPDTKDEHKNNLGTKGSSQTLSSKSTYVGWDFNKIWEMRSGLLSSYPTLRFIGSKNYLYYLEFEDEGKILSRQLLSGGSKVDFSAPYEKKGYTFAYWEKDDIYYYPNDSHLLTDDGVYTAVWIYNNSGEETWDSSVTDKEWQGSGTEADPYLITSAEELAGLSESVNEDYRNTYEGVFFKQTNDIYLNDAYDYSHTVMAQNTWTPIGNSNRTFKGNYDGNGHTVYGIYIKSNENYNDKIHYGGLFGQVSNVTIKNLTVDASYLEHFGDTNYYGNYGGFVGIVYYDCFIKLENCINKANVHTEYYAGGFVGYVEDNVIITDSSNYGEITAPTAGGFVGCVYNSLEQAEIVIKNSTNYGNVSDKEFLGNATGGFIGRVSAYNALISDITELIGLENKGKITCKNGYAGGIVGSLEYTETVEDCVNNGEINALTAGGIFGNVTRYASINNSVNNAKVCASKTTTNSFPNAGGIVGVCSGGSTYINACENNGIIESEEKAGGILGSGNAYIYDSVNNGSVTAERSAGGIAGESSSYITGCANLGNVKSVNSYAGGIVGYWPWASYSRMTDCYNAGNVTGDDVGGILGYDNTTGNGGLENCYNMSDVTGEGNVGGIVGHGDAINCYNMGNVTGEGSAGGIVGHGNAINCYNIGDVTGERNVGGIVGEGTARYSYNTGDVTGENNYVGGISGRGGASNCYNTGTVEGEYDVGGISGDGNSSYCYNIGDVCGKYYVGVISGTKNDSHINCYYLDSVVISCEESSSLYYNGTSVDSETLSLGALEGFDFEETWEVGVAADYDYPTLKDTTHAITYTVTFLDTDGTVLKEQKVRDGWSASPPVVEPYTDADYVYAIDHWDGEYKNVKSNVTVTAVYNKVAKIKFNGVNHNLTVPLGFSADNLKVLIESSYSKLLCTTTHDYKMNCDVDWDLSNYNPNASGKYLINGTLTITESPYYEMAAGETVSVSVTVLSGDENQFDQSHLTYTTNDDNTVTITGYTGSAEDIIIPSTLDGYTVSGIADNAFKDNNSIISVYIPSSVKTIGQRAFAGCSALVQVTFSEGLVSVGEYAFGDTGLTGVTLPQSLEAVGEKAFGCYDEESFVQGFTIYAFEGTVAESFAEQWEINCVVVEKKTDSYTGITVIAEEGVELSVSKVFSGDYFETADSIVEKANISLFEIKIYSDTDDELQPGNMMTISVPVPEGFSQGSKVYRINADGSYMDMNARIVDGMLVFNTAHLSYYAIISESSAIPGDVDGNGEIDTSDLASLKLHLAGVEVVVSEGADVNGNGVVDTSDLAELKLRLAGI